MKKRIISLVISITAIISLCSCASIDTSLKVMKGELVGNGYDIGQWDNFGNPVLTISGSRVALSSDTSTDGSTNSYLDITIDGKQWSHVGGTLVFAQRGVDIVTDFDTEGFENSGSESTGFIGIDRYVNDFQNSFGKKLVVLISTQNGTPLMILQGDKCYTEVPGDLPKTTLINIDGKLVYVHRANIDIMDASMFTI